MGLDPARLALNHALGDIQDAGRLLKRVPECSGLVDRLRVIAKEINARLDGMPLQEKLELPAAEEKKRPAWMTEELDWRVAETVGAHLRAFKEFKRRATGTTPTNGADLPAPIKKLIREALPVYDGELLKPEQRDAWKRDSRVRAAGIGIFYDEWMTGEFENKVKPDSWHGPYLDHDRPWRRRNGGIDPVLRFSEKYFEARALAGSGQ